MGFERALRMTLLHETYDAAHAVLVVNESEDVREGIQAFLEKREPHFRGLRGSCAAFRGSLQLVHDTIIY